MTIEHFNIALDAHLTDAEVEIRINARYWQQFASEDAWWRTADAGGVEQFGYAPGWTQEFRNGTAAAEV